MISSRRRRYVRKSIGSTGQHRRKLSRRAIYQGVLQMVVLLSLDRNHELSLLTSNHIPFASRRKHDVLIPRQCRRYYCVRHLYGCRERLGCRMIGTEDVGRSFRSSEKPVTTHQGGMCATRLFQTSVANEVNKIRSLASAISPADTIPH